VAVDPASPRSVVNCLRLVDAELRNLPRSERANAALTTARSSAFALARAGNDDFPQAIETLLTALAAVHEALASSYFPELQPAPHARLDAEGDGARASLDPFEYLEREHVEIQAVLRVLEELAFQSERSGQVEKSEIRSIVAYLTECGELGHHEKEEAILTPKLVEHGFDWFEGPVAMMRREHRHEHLYLSVLGHLTHQTSPWSTEDAHRFATDARALCDFLRSHMDHERHDLFDQAARILPEPIKTTLARAFRDFDARQEQALSPVRARMAALVDKYRVSQPMAPA